MKINDLMGLEKPLTKLIEVVGEGLGVTGNAVFKFDVKKIKRTGEAEAEIEKLKIIKKAEGQAQALQIFDRATKRFAVEQYNKQINLENIIFDTRKTLEGSIVSDNPVEKDWSTRFMNIAQDVSREDVQKILSKILAGEIKEPSTFSLRTLDYVKNMTKSDLSLLKKITLLSDSQSTVHIPKGDPNEGFSNISYVEILDLIENGYIQSSLSIQKTITAKDKKIIYSIRLRNETTYIFENTNDTEKVSFPVIFLTKIAGELAPVFEYTNEDYQILTAYMSELMQFLESRNLKLIKKI